MKNRKLLAVLSMILVLCMAFSACGGQTTTTAAPEAQTTGSGESQQAAESTAAPTPSGDDFSDRVLNAAYSGIADLMDPFLCMNSIACSICTEQVYSALMKRDENHAITYNIADEYTVTEDGKEYVFHV